MLRLTKPDRALEPIRRVVLSPYRPGHGPTFTLTLWDTAKPRDSRGVRPLAYRLTSSVVVACRARSTVLFSGDDYSPSPMHSTDGDESVLDILGFLTVRPGDVEDDYFANYTDAQRAFCAEHAEALGLESMARFDKQFRAAMRKERASC